MKAVINENEMVVKVKLDEGAYMPESAHDLDAGYDLRTPVPFALGCMTTARGAGSAIINTGVHVEIPDGYVGMLKAKSGLNVKEGIVGEGVVDAGYTGAIKVKLYNLGGEVKHFDRGDKIIQLVIMPIVKPVLVQADELEETERGDGGFGSTGR